MRGNRGEVRIHLLKDCRVIDHGQNDGTIWVEINMSAGRYIRCTTWRCLECVQGSSQRHRVAKLGGGTTLCEDQATERNRVDRSLRPEVAVACAHGCSTRGQRLWHIYCHYHNFLLLYAHLVAVMFKIWRQAWRRGVGVTNSTPRHDSDQEAQLGRTDNEGTCFPSIDVASPTVDDVSGTVLSATGRKRALSHQSSSFETGSPPKRQKAVDDTAPGRPELSHNGPLRPSEVVVLYEPPSKLTFTPLYKHLREVDNEEKYSRRHFSAALQVLLDMGSCASDLVWRRALPDLDVSVSLAYNEDEEHAKEYVALFETREIIKNWEYTMPNLDSSSRGLNVTPKFLKLVQILQSCRPHEESFRGIVFGEHPSHR